MTAPKTRPAAYSKYHVRTDALGRLQRTVQGQLCDSLAEARRYRVLLALEVAGELTQLRFHPRYDLVVPDHQGRLTFIATYEADFAYHDRAGVEHVEDVKGVVMDSFRLKRRLLAALWGIEVEVLDTKGRLRATPRPSKAKRLKTKAQHVGSRKPILAPARGQIRASIVNRQDATCR